MAHHQTKDYKLTFSFNSILKKVINHLYSHSVKPVALVKMHTQLM